MADKRLGQGCALSVEALEAKQLLAADCGIDDAAVVAQSVEAPVAPIALDEAAQIALPADLPSAFATTVEFQGQTLTLQLEKSSVFGENTRFLVDDGSGQLTPIDHGPDLSYIGTVEGFSGYSVSAVLSESGLIASVFRPGEPTLLIEPAYNGSRSDHRVSEAVIDPAAFNHDHDGDGIPDHSAEDHPNTTGGGHPPGCTCAGCCAGGDTAALTPGEVSPDSVVPVSPVPSEGGLLPAAATLPPTRVLEVLEYEIGVEIGSAALQNNYSGSTTAQKVASATAVIQGLPGNLDSRFLHAAGIKHRLGTVIIRTGEPGNTDPFTVSNGNDSPGLSAFRNYWNNLQSNEGIAPTHDLAVYHVRASPSGLAYVNHNGQAGTVGTPNRYALSASNGPTSWASGTIAHEFGHSWSLPHTGDGMNSGLFYENRPRNNNGSTTAGGRADFISPMNGSGDHNIGRFATDEANRIFGVREARRSAGDVVANPGPIKPFGHRDDVLVGSQPVVIDVIENDFDFNNDVLDVELLDTVSFLGGTVSLSMGTGPGGRNEILYTPPAGGGNGDFFHYTVVDSTGRTDFGAVHVESSFIGVDTALDFYSYDPGPQEGPVFSGGDPPVQAVALLPVSTGDVFWTGNVFAFDHGSDAGNAYNRDLIFSNENATLSHKIENGRWRVTVNMSDPSRNLSNMFVRAEGLPGLSDLDHSIGSNPTLSFEVDVLDGELNLEFGDADTINPFWAVNRINLQQLEAFVSPLLEGDYNDDGVVDAADYTVYRDTFGQAVATPFAGADGNGDRMIDAADRAVWAANYGAELVSVPLITATLGNGEFAMDNVNDASSVGGGSAPLTTDVGRDRAFRSEGTVGRGVGVLGWEITRVDYNGGNSAIGVDGNYGFATDAGTDPGQTGQAFVNSGSVNVTSDAIARDFKAGEKLDLSYLLGSDTNGATASVNATVSFILDQGLATERVTTLPARTATGLTTPAITEKFTLPADASSLTVRFLLDGGLSQRTLLDSVTLDLSTSSAFASSSSTLVMAPLTPEEARETAALEAEEIEAASTQEVSLTRRVRFVPMRDPFRTIENAVVSPDLVLASPDSTDRLNLLSVEPAGPAEAEEEESLLEELASKEELAIDTAFDSLTSDLFA